MFMVQPAGRAESARTQRPVQGMAKHVTPPRPATRSGPPCRTNSRREVVKAVRQDPSRVRPPIDRPVRRARRPCPRPPLVEQPLALRAGVSIRAAMSACTVSGTVAGATTAAEADEFPRRRAGRLPPAFPPADPAAPSASRPEDGDREGGQQGRGLVRQRSTDRVNGVVLATAPAGSSRQAARVAQYRRQGAARRGPVGEVVDEVEHPSSAQCRSSKTRTSGTSAARLEKRRHAAKASPRVAATDVLPPRNQQAAEVSADPFALAPSSTPSPDPRASTRPLRVVGFEDARLCLDHLAEGPERDALAVGQGTALAPDGRTPGRHRSAKQLPHSRLLPIPGAPPERDQLRFALGPCRS